MPIGAALPAIRTTAIPHNTNKAAPKCGTAQIHGRAALPWADRIELDVPQRKLNLLVDDAELARRRAQWKPPKPHFNRGFGTLYLKHVTQADKGCDFDFLEPLEPATSVPCSAKPGGPEPEIH